VTTSHPKDYKYDQLLTTTEAAQLATHWRALHSGGHAKVTPGTIRQWRHRGQLKPRRLDTRGRALYHRDDLADTERALRDIALSPHLALRTP
jgi:DNA-binding transcriptional MerR regulator